MEATTKKRGKKKMPDSERKRRKAVRSAESNRTRISIGSEHERWKRIQEANDLKSDREVATLLIDRSVYFLDEDELVCNSIYKLRSFVQHL